jgi:hypothetical protein
MPILDPSKTISPVSSMMSKTKPFKEEIMEELTKKFMEKLQDMVNQKVQDALKKPNIKNLKRPRHN